MLTVRFDACQNFTIVLKATEKIQGRKTPQAEGLLKLLNTTIHLWLKILITETKLSLRLRDFYSYSCVVIVRQNTVFNVTQYWPFYFQVEGLGADVGAKESRRHSSRRERERDQWQHCESNYGYSCLILVQIKRLVCTLNNVLQSHLQHQGVVIFAFKSYIVSVFVLLTFLRSITGPVRQWTSWNEGSV